MSPVDPVKPTKCDENATISTWKQNEKLINTRPVAWKVDETQIIPRLMRSLSLLSSTLLFSFHRLHNIFGCTTAIHRWDDGDVYARLLTAHSIADCFSSIYNYTERCNDFIVLNRHVWLFVHWPSEHTKSFNNNYRRRKIIFTHFFLSSPLPIDAFLYVSLFGSFDARRFNYLVDDLHSIYFGSVSVTSAIISCFWSHALNNFDFHLKFFHLLPSSVVDVVISGEKQINYSI